MAGMGFVATLLTPTLFLRPYLMGPLEDSPEGKGGAP